VHDDDEDEFLQKVGFRVDGIMNSSYHCALYTLNIFLLFWTDDVTEIILNALAIEFVKEIDEIISSSGWYDGSDYRYLKAGAIEMVIRRYVSFHVLDKDLKIGLKDAAQKSKAASWGASNAEKQQFASKSSVVVNDSARNTKVRLFSCRAFKHSLRSIPDMCIYNCGLALASSSTSYRLTTRR
jgi:hypothetical protein